MNDLKNQIAKLSNDHNEINDCTVRGLAVALDGDYATAHAACKRFGRKKGRGLNIGRWTQAYKSCGIELDDVTNNFDGKTIRIVERELRERCDKRKYLLNTRSHVCAWDGNEIVDWAAGRYHRIQTVFHMRPEAEEKQFVRAKIVVHEEKSDLSDCTFVMCEPGRSRDGDYRIYIRENGKVRWLNTKRWQEDAEEAAYRAGVCKRNIGYAGVVSREEDVPDYVEWDSYRGYW